MTPQNQKAFTHGIVAQVGREIDQDPRVHCVPIHFERYLTLVVDDQSLSSRCKVPTLERLPICHERDRVNLGAFISFTANTLFHPECLAALLLVASPNSAATTNIDAYLPADFLRGRQN